MSSTLIRGKYVICKVTSPDSAEVIFDGAVFQRDGEIIEVGRYDNLKAHYAADEVIGSPNYVVMPGFINAHSHVGVTPFQLGVPDLPLELWLPAKMGSKQVDPYLDHLYAAAQMIKSGTTTVQVLTFGHIPANPEVTEKVLKAYQESGMRVSFGAGITNMNYAVAGARGGEKDFISQLPDDLARRFKSFMAGIYLPTDELISNVDESCTNYAGNRYERVRVFVSPNNVHRCSDDLLLALKQVATKHKVGIHLHLQETVYQRIYGLNAWGKTPLQHLHDLGFLGPEVTAAHCVWVTDEDIDVMAATGTNACHLPSSNLRLQSGIAPVNRLLEKGIRIALGTDEAGINDDKDMLQEMRMALKLHRVPGVENTPLTAHQVFQMATVNGARDSGFDDRIGNLEPGKRADIVLINLQNIEEPYLNSEVSIVDAVIHRGRSIDVDTVMVDGEVVLRDGQLTRIDVEALFRELKKLQSRPLTPREKERKELYKQLEPYLKRFYAGTTGELSQPHYCYNARS